VDVQNVQSYGGYILHTGYMKYGTFSIGDEILVEYDELRRQSIRTNHTGTHVLNYALRETLGWEVDQKGSLVAPEKLRFDFSHKSGLSDTELEKITKISNSYISDNHEVFSREVDLPTAQQIYGVRAVFGETYPDPVRVVSIGKEVKDLLQDAKSKEWEKYSIEFCGGTHVDRTGEIKELVILEESAIARGIRRIIAVTGQDAINIHRTAEIFNEKLTALENSTTVTEKEKQAKLVGVELNELSISTLTKKSFVKRLEKIKTDIVKGQKEQQKAENEKVLKLIKDHFAAQPDSQTFVAKIPFSVNNKAVPEAIKWVSTKEKNRSVYLISEDPAHRVNHGCFVSDVSPPHIVYFMLLIASRSIARMVSSPVSGLVKSLKLLVERLVERGLLVLDQAQMWTSLMRELSWQQSS